MTRLPRVLPARLRPERIRRAAAGRIRSAAARWGPPRTAPELLAVLDGCTLTVRLPLTGAADLELRSGRRRIRLPLAPAADGAAAAGGSGTGPAFSGAQQGRGAAQHRTGCGPEVPAARRGGAAGGSAVPVRRAGEPARSHRRQNTAAAGAALAPPGAAPGGIGASLALHGSTVEVPDGRWELAVVTADGRRVLEAPAAAPTAVPGCAVCGREFAVEADALSRAVLSVRPRSPAAELRGLLLRPHCATVLAALTGPGRGGAPPSADPAAFAVPAGGGAPVPAATRSDPETGGFRIDLPVSAMAAAGGRWEIAVAPPSAGAGSGGADSTAGTGAPAAGLRVRLGPGALLPPDQPFRAPARTVLPPDGPPVRIRTSATNEGVLTVSANLLGLPR
ncbi:hypothetical protein [Nocardiopsis coralliicola]